MNRKVCIKTSSIHNKGLFARTAINAGEHILEYTGERITKKEGSRRSDAQEAAGKPMVIFALDKLHDIDASIGGSGAEYANHSCNPNAESVIEDRHIWLIALKDTLPGDEITYDYNVGTACERTPCHCGAKNCRGTINRKKR